MGKLRVAVLGAGYGGLSAFMELQHRLRSWASDVVLVNQSPYHYFTVQLHSLAVGADEDGLRVPLRRILHGPGRLLIAKVERLVPQSRTVILADQPPLTYDYCVVALGSDPEFFHVPGAAEYGLVIGTPAAARRVRRRLLALLAGQGAKTPLQVVVVGGGLTGVEVAGELADMYGRRLSLTLVEAGPEIMAGFEPYLVAEARRVLSRKGVHILTGTPIRRATAGDLALDGNSRLPYDLFIWAGGVRGNAVPAASGLKTTPRGRMPVDSCLRSHQWPEIYAVGDVAAFTLPTEGDELPPTAQAAVQMGRHAARNLVRRLRGAAETPFAPRIRGAFVSLGRYRGVGHIGREGVAGWPAMAIKGALEAHHAYEVGGVLPVLTRLFRPVARLLRGRPGVPPSYPQCKLEPGYFLSAISEECPGKTPAPGST